MTGSDLIDDFYFLCKILNDEYECVASFLKRYKLTNKKKSLLIFLMENLLLKRLTYEINSALDIKMSDIRKFAKEWQKVREKKENKKIIERSLF
ncbi:hypothetical protein YZ82_08175 [Campylobacter hyointestinalis]|uniref:Uncharacterized protein n=1 Tax=Campylobacter hyointestinalis TaxID=198 RepID=A0A562X704_CAMHY|nr:hypothetical protein [Campylobacter hyointestinalis]TWO17974.1 hypothetical protein YZ82_08175 [Campylobacter hyointestinalis]